MNPERWRQIDELFDAALDVPESERERFLSVKCDGDENLRSEVWSLLRAEKEGDNFLRKSAMRIAAENLADSETIADDAHFLDCVIGTYRIESLLGAGGMGEVYLADDRKLNRKVALKILPREYTASDERVKRFELEARAISLLNHPNIVTIYDVGSSAEGVNFIATEFVEGKNLREIIGGGRLKMKDALTIIIQVCEALAAAHRAGIIHRDIKPENVMVRPDGYVKVLDFGLAKLSDVGANTLKNVAQTAKGVIIGTPAYMSPEQVSDENVDHRTDLWSVGVVLYELLTGVNPFKKENRKTTFQAVLSAEPPPAGSLNSEISAELDQILRKALEKDADLSYQTASDLRADLKRVKREIDSSPSRKTFRNAETANEKNSEFRNWKIFPYYVTAFLLLGAAIVGIWFFMRSANAPVGKEANEWKNAQNLQLTDSQWVEGYPSLSPDGKHIVFASDESDDRNIFRQRVGGKNFDNLTPNSKESDTMPAFSPDGKLIAFRSERNPAGIYVMEETGENARRVADIGFHPSWSSDGQKIVVSDKAAAIHTSHTVPNSSLFIIDAATGTKQKLETGGDAIMPNWSPNNHRIAFWFVADGKLPEIATVAATGGAPVSIAADDAASDWNPVWSPDGKYLYFASDRGGNMNLWRVAVDEKTGVAQGEPESVTTPSKYLRHLTFSRDGKTLAYVRYESQSNLQSIAFDPKTLKTAGEANWITRGDREISTPEMSPDGARFVVRGPTRTQEDLVIFDRDGGNWRSLTNDKSRERVPRWSPDGSRIAFASDRSGKYQIWTINSDDSGLQQITFSEKTAANSAVFSPDGARLAFTEIDGDARSSFILDLSKKWTEQTPQLLAPASNNQFFSVRDWSPDGKKILSIYFPQNGVENGIGVLDLETSRHEKMTDSGANPFWLADNRHFIFTARNAIFLCDTQTKQVTGLYKSSAYEIQHANISRDNKLIFFRHLQVNADVWLIEAATEQNP